MRIVLDLQGAQTANRLRGIGRHTEALTSALLRRAHGHEIHVVLNGLLAESVGPLRTAFEGLLPQERIHVWETPGPVRELDPMNAWRLRVAERLREAFLLSLRPDLVHIFSLFEGLIDDAVTSIGAFSTDMPTSVTLHDLIPLLHRETYLADPVHEAWYERKIGHLRRARLWLAVSESSRREGIEHLGLPEERVVNISSAADARFRPVALGADGETAVRNRYGLKRPFVMYTGGIDTRKNIEGLIHAYARLPDTIRYSHQLAIVCDASREDRARMERLADRSGLGPDEVVMTGFVPDEDLVALYSLCRLFVFPSWHEGFGLPALEAMACGAPTIGADTSSLPEVIGRRDALFDLRDEKAMAAKMGEALTDAVFREDLARHGLEQARRFSWDETARRTLEAFEQLHEDERERCRAVAALPSRRLRLAYVSPLPPERSGIADYSAELLPELARHYDIDVVVDQMEVSDPWVRANCPIRDAAWFDTHANLYDRIVYHFGNSLFHRHMFGLLERHPGVVVLHDFFLSGVLAALEGEGLEPGVWVQALYRSHGYPAVASRYSPDGPAGETIWKYPCNLPVLQAAAGVMVHSESSRRLAESWYGANSAVDWAVVPHPRARVGPVNRRAARTALGYGEEDFVVASFGMLGPTKLNHRLLSAWLASGLAEETTCRLIFVGENEGGAYGAKIQDMIRGSGRGERIRVTGFASRDLYRRHLEAVDVAVQLRTLSRGETSRSVLDCMAHGLATVVNAHGAMAELPKEGTWQIADRFEDEELAAALVHLRDHPTERREIGRRAQAHVQAIHAPRAVADRYTEAIEAFYRGPATVRPRLVRLLASMEETPPTEEDWLRMAAAIAADLPGTRSGPQLLVDVSLLVQEDLRTGIQRLARGVLRELLLHPPKGYRVEPVYATAEGPYRYARAFTLRFLGCPDRALDDEVVELGKGDRFLGLDLAPHPLPRHTDSLSRLRRMGGEVYVVVYDLLPIRYPDWFPPELCGIFQNWLETVVSETDGALCISQATADDLTQWLEERPPGRTRPFRVGWFRLGADVRATLPTDGVPKGFEDEIDRLRRRPSILMVGTVEPRKGHAQALAAFERLWAQGFEANLVVVGKEGWMVGDLVRRLRHHPERGRRLFWFEGVSDEALERLYTSASGLLMASRGEGFGLPLVEAARHGIPILARDLPVFREVAGGHAEYFRAETPDELARAIGGWLGKLGRGTAPDPSGISLATWSESTADVIGLLTEPDHPNWRYRWSPQKDRRAGQTDRFSVGSAG